MPSDGARIRAGYRANDKVLVAQGHHPTPEGSWMATLERFWLSGKRRLVVRKGRQGGGSTTLARVAVATALFGEHRFSPGTRLMLPFVSVKISEARERLHNIATILDALGEPYTRREDTIELHDHPIVFAVYACSLRTSVGMTSIALVEDETSRWWSDDRNANPAIEVDAALIPSLITQPNARIYTSSSPLGTEDFHAVLMARGENAGQCVAEGPSWFWNPAITEEATHELQPDLIRWRREFLAIPQAGALGAFDPEAVASIARPLRDQTHPLDCGALVIDSASGGDEFTFCAAQFVLEPCGELPYLDEERVTHDFRGVPSAYRYPLHDSAGRQVPNPKYGAPVRRLFISEIGAFEGDYGKTTSFAEIVATIARVGHRYGISTCFGDQHLAFALSTECARHGIRFESRPWTAQSKVDAASTLRRLIREKTIVVDPGPHADAMKRELLTLEERITPSGTLTISSKRSAGGHADRAHMLLLAARLEAEGELAGSPIARSRGVTETSTYEGNFEQFT